MQDADLIITSPGNGVKGFPGHCPIIDMKKHAWVFDVIGVIMYWKRINKIVDDGCQAYIDVKYICSNCGEVAPLNDWFLYDLVDICPYCGDKWSEDDYLKGEVKGRSCSET